MLTLARSHRPHLRLVHKRDVPWMRALGAAVRPVVPDFDASFTTVLGDTLYLPKPVEAFDRDVLASIVAHEIVHQLDQRAWGLAFYASYLAVPLPVGRTVRAWWERRAYAVDLMLAWEEGGERRMEEVAERIVGLFTGANYGWMWAGTESARAYLKPVLDDIRAGALQRRGPYREILSAWRGQPVPAAAPEPV